MIPRKSALKQSSGSHKVCTNGPSTFRSLGQQGPSTAQPHLPPPEFADLPSPSESRPSQPALEFISTSGELLISMISDSFVQLKLKFCTSFRPSTIAND